MKSAIIFGEFIEKSTTGIAYMNSVLETSLHQMGFHINKFYDPRYFDYQKENLVNEKNLNFKKYIKLFIDLSRLKKNNIAFITLSFHKKLGMLKILLIIFFLINKSDFIYVFVHRGDLYKEYKSSMLKSFIINFIFLISNKVIFLSSKIRSEMLFLNKRSKKFEVLSNCLNKKDILKSNVLFNKVRYFPKKNKYNCIFSSNIRKSKGIFEIIESITNLNKISQTNYFLDLYGMKFDQINTKENKNIIYKGKLNYFKRLEVMAKYDFLILASETEGLPMILLECMAIGLPFITTKVGAIEELLGENYPYYCKKDTLSIMGKINQLVDDIKRKNIQEIILINRKKVVNFYTYKNYRENLEKLISKNITI